MRDTVWAVTAIQFCDTDLCRLGLLQCCQIEICFISSQLSSVIYVSNTICSTRAPKPDPFQWHRLPAVPTLCTQHFGAEPPLCAISCRGRVCGGAGGTGTDHTRAHLQVGITPPCLQGKGSFILVSSQSILKIQKFQVPFYFQPER